MTAIIRLLRTSVKTCPHQGAHGPVAWGIDPSPHHPGAGTPAPGALTVAAPSRLDSVVSLAKRRGFVFQSGEIYGGSRSAWDYGPLGVELKENIKKQWWRTVVQSRDDVVGLDSAVILPRQVWVASGHVGVFTDPLTECLHC